MEGCIINFNISNDIGDDKNGSYVNRIIMTFL